MIMLQRAKAVSAAVALVALSATGAIAADLGAPRRNDVDSRPAIWNGLYAGITLGATASAADIDGVGSRGRDDVQQTNVSIGGLLGYNFTSGPWVFGVETDMATGGLNRSSPVAGLGTVSAESRWYGSVRLRAGYAFDNLLVYATGGLAFADFDVRSSRGGRENGIATGLALGVGAEYAIDSNWRVRAEALAYGVGSDDATFAGVKRDTGIGHGTMRLGITRRF